jgi:hypothetical protein
MSEAGFKDCKVRDGDQGGWEIAVSVSVLFSSTLIVPRERPRMLIAEEPEKRRQATYRTEKSRDAKVCQTIHTEVHKSMEDVPITSYM